MRIFNNKLYNQYYPIQTETEKNMFLNSHRHELVNNIRRIMDDIETEYLIALKKGLQRTVLEDIYKKYEAFCRIANTLYFTMNDDMPTPSIEDVNLILKTMNKETHYKWKLLLVAITLILSVTIM